MDYLIVTDQDYFTRYFDTTRVEVSPEIVMIVAPFGAEDMDVWRAETYTRGIAHHELLDRFWTDDEKTGHEDVEVRLYARRGMLS